VAYILENLIHNTTNKPNDGSLRGKLKELLYNDSPILIKLFLDTPNLKLKLSMSNMLTVREIYQHF
jgi:hypothetical protein